MVSKDKKAIITGVTNGIGKELAKIFTEMGFKLLIVSRDKERIEKLIKELQKINKNADPKYYITDISILSNVYETASKIADEHTIIDILINNAGTYLGFRQETTEKKELTLATNYLGPFLLTNQLLSLLKRGENTQILNICSFTHRNAKIHWNDLDIKKKWLGFKAYGQSKLLLTMFTLQLASRLRDFNIRVNAYDPGVVNTNLGLNSIPDNKMNFELLLGKITRKLGLSPNKVANTIAKVLFSDSYSKFSGTYFYKGKLKDPSRDSRNLNLQEKAWDRTCSIISEVLNSNDKQVEGCL